MVVCFHSKELLLINSRKQLSQVGARWSIALVASVNLLSSHQFQKAPSVVDTKCRAEGLCKVYGS